MFSKGNLQHLHKLGFDCCLFFYELSCCFAGLVSTAGPEDKENISENAGMSLSPSVCKHDEVFKILMSKNVTSFFPLKGPKVVYVPPPPPEDENSIFAQFATGINFDKYDDILVDVSGSNPPKAIMVSFWFSLYDRRT